MSENKNGGLLSPALYERWKSNDFGYLEMGTIIEAAKGANAAAKAENKVDPFPVDEKGYLKPLQDNRETVAFLRSLGTIPATKAKEQLAEAREKVVNLRKFNKDLVDSNSDFSDKLKEAEVVTSLNVTAAAAKGQRDFKSEVGQAWKLVKELQAFALPKRQEYAKALYDEALKSVGSDPEAVEAVEKHYARATADDAGIGGVEAFINYARGTLGVVVKRANTEGSNGNGFTNTAKVVNDPASRFYPKKTRGLGSKGRRSSARS